MSLLLLAAAERFPWQVGCFLAIMGFFGALWLWTKLKPRRPPMVADSPEFRQLLRDRLPLLMELGFFADLRGFPLEEAIGQLAKRIEEEWCDDVTECRRKPATLAMYDRARVWHQDLEAEVFAGSDVYVETLQRWAEISRGAFKPESIVEEWSIDNKSVVVRFRHEGHDVVLNPKVLDDWLDVSIISDIDKLVSPKGMNFLVPPMDYGQEMAFVVVTEEERRRLRDEAGWKGF